MSITATLQPLILLIISSLILMTGHGLSGILLPVRLATDNISLPVSGFILSMYSFGFLLGATVAKRILKQIGQVRTFAMCGSLTATAILLMGLRDDMFIWALMRGLMGFCIACACVTLDSWFGSVSTEENRGRILGINQVVILSAITLGQFALLIAPPTESTLFVLCGILFSLSITPLVFVSHYEPSIEQTPHLPLRQLFALSPLGVVTGFLCGMLYSSMVNLLPLYASSEHITGLRLSLFMGAAMVGGIVLQFPIGYLSDRFERRKVILGCCLLLSLTTIALPVTVTTGQFGAMLICSAFTMGIIACLYPLSISETFDQAQKGQLLSVLSGLLGIYAAGAMIAPYTATVAMQHQGEVAVFGFMLAIELLLIGFTLYRMRVAPPIAVEAQETFVMHTPNMIYEELDPRTAYRETSADFEHAMSEFEKLAAEHPNNAIAFVRAISAAHPDWAAMLAEKATQFPDIDTVLLFRALTMLNSELAVDIASRLAQGTPEQAEALVDWLLDKEPENALTLLANIAFIAQEQQAKVVDALAQTSPEKIQAFSQEYVDSMAENLASLRAPDREDVNIEHCVTGLLDSVTAAAPEQMKQVAAIVDEGVGDWMTDQNESETKRE
ncbi:MFS transporter [Photobacterium sp. CCB-ST2H9]|uniref:MFS transporter n=1 Tax=Photobacterium sp. CCB-ST2H9 TaxID=2912855 RepID=UPI00200430CB|nr:MFS transporter [Photobacterium sp. CCB-ST2H9]UTM59580.1 MFS transporter [Photobacterium sp. CCB-ST2H9]